MKHEVQAATPARAAVKPDAKSDAPEGSETESVDTSHPFRAALRARGG